MNNSRSLTRLLAAFAALHFVLGGFCQSIGPGRTSGGGLSSRGSGFYASEPPGVDTFYYSFGESNPTSESFWGADQFYAVPVVATLAGPITKVGWKLHNSEGAANNVRIGLWWNNGGTWTLHECQVLVLDASAAAAFYDITLASPYSVGASETVRVSCVSEDGGLNVGRFHGTPDTGGYKVTRTYADGCLSTEPTWGGTEESGNGARVYVD